MICIIGSETTQNYGLLNDLSNLEDYRIVYTRPPFLFGTIAWKIVRRIRTHIFNIKTMHMTWERSILKDLNRFERIVVIDTALRWLELSFLDKCKELKPNLQIDCLLLNSTKSITLSRPEIHSKLYSYNWNSILSFDPYDSEKNNWIYIGLHYYSKHALRIPQKPHFDLIYAGSIMGQRGVKLLHLLNGFNENHVKCHFICPSLGRRHYFSKQPKGIQLIWKRISYEKILKKTIECNCILEVLQEGQGGSTLRYMEAVCYNKKLLTTNSEITKYPFYDKRYMKVFSNESDIDYEWIKKIEPINYGYKNEFSPINLKFSSSEIQTP